MISLQPPAEPFDLTIVQGVTFTVKPLTSFDMLAARAKAERTVASLRDSLDVIGEAGLTVPQGYDPADPAHTEAVFRDVMIKELGVSQIIGWTGVKGETGEDDLPVEPEFVRGLLSSHIIADIFYARITEWHAAKLSAKKGSGPGAPGQCAAGSNTAKTAEPTTSPVHADSAEKTGSSAPS